MNTEYKIKSIETVKYNGEDNAYWVGLKMGEQQIEVDEIKLSYITLNGDPVNHYIGFSKQGRMLFSINAQIPVEIKYL